MKRISKGILLSGIVATHLMGQAAYTCTSGIVTSNADDGDNTLRACIETVTTGSAITFSKDMNISLSATLSMNSKNLAIDGKDHKIILDGGGTLSPLLSVSSSDLNLSNITVQNAQQAIVSKASTLRIKNSVITKNLGADKQNGSGISLDSSTLTLANSTVSKNKSPRYGGGISVRSSILTMTNSTISDNNASNGAGIYTNGSKNVSITNSTISGNTATSYGGGIYTEKSTLNIIQTTITNNNASNYNAIYDRSGSTISLSNSIMAGNVNTGKYAEFVSITSVGYNLLGFGTFSLDATSLGGVSNPQLSALANNTGDTLTHMPLEGSPAIGKGGNNSKGAPKDQIGQTRPDNNITIGAVEFIIPTASSISFTGTLKEGETLTGAYTYADAHNYSETTSLFQWYRSDDASGTNKTGISGATSKTYTLASADIGKFMSFSVIAKSANGTGILSSSDINSTAVIKLNTPPTINIDSSVGTTKDTARTILFTFSDIDKDTVIPTEKTAPNNGTIKINGLSITYTPEAGFVGSDSFVISFDDQQGGIVDKTIVVVISKPKETPKTETPKAETPKTETPKTETPKAETPKAETPKAETEKTPVDITVNTITRIISSLANTKSSTDEKTKVVTVSAEVKNTDGFTYKGVIVTDKEGKSKTKIIKIEIATGKETLVANTLKDNEEYPAGSRIELLLKDNKLVIKISAKLSKKLTIE